MNWAGIFAQKQIDPSDLVLDLGCGVMQATMDFVSTYPKTRLQCGSLLGVDIYEPYLNFLKAKGIKVMKHDLTQVPFPFADKSYDVVLLLDILEHLSLKQAEALEQEASRIARKKVIIVTPAIFFPNEKAITYDKGIYKGLGNNEFQRHHCFISKKWLLQRNYRIDFKGFKTPYFAAVKRMNLKILHVWCQAGVGFLMATYQRRLGHQADVLKLEEKGSDIEGFYGFGLLKKPVIIKGMQRDLYEKIRFAFLKKLIRGMMNKLRSLKFYCKVAIQAKNYDILHVHSLWKVVLVTPFKKKILEFHGDDCRKHPSFLPVHSKVIVRLFILLYTLFFKVYVSTPDLLQEIPNSQWIPNPVDPEHFKRTNKPVPKSALYSHNWYETGDHAKDIAAQYNLYLTVHDRAANEWIIHSQFPAFLSKFEYYIDRKNIRSFSKTALEALAMGLKVIQGWDGKIVQGLNPKHLPENVAANTIEIYKERIS